MIVISTCWNVFIKHGSSNKSWTIFIQNGNLFSYQLLYLNTTTDIPCWCYDVICSLFEIWCFTFNIGYIIIDKHSSTNVTIALDSFLFTIVTFTKDLNFALPVLRILRIWRSNLDGNPADLYWNSSSNSVNSCP